VRERTRAGLEAARDRRGGRPTKVTPDKLAAAIAMRNDPDMTMDQIAKALQVSRASTITSLALPPARSYLSWRLMLTD
jgi:transposase